MLDQIYLNEYRVWRDIFLGMLQYWSIWYSVPTLLCKCAWWCTTYLQVWIWWKIYWEMHAWVMSTMREWEMLNEGAVRSWTLIMFCLTKCLKLDSNDRWRMFEVGFKCSIFVWELLKFDTLALSATLGAYE